MKKTLLMIAAVAVMALTLGACGKFVCNECGKVKSEGKHVWPTTGQILTLCSDCYWEAQTGLKKPW